jgi:hypothetical protein
MEVDLLHDRLGPGRELLQLGPLLGRRVLGGEAGDRGLEHRPHLHEVAERRVGQTEPQREGPGHVLGVGMADPDAAAGAALHRNQPVFFEQPEGLPHGGTAQVELLDQLRLRGERRALGHPLPEDDAAEIIGQDIGRLGHPSRTDLARHGVG